MISEEQFEWMITIGGMKQIVNMNGIPYGLIARKRQGRKTVSHGSYRAKRKPNSPRVTLEEHLKAKATL